MSEGVVTELIVVRDSDSPVACPANEGIEACTEVPPTDGAVAPEDRADSVRLTRAALPMLVKALREATAHTACSWNVVDAAELLIEAGHYHLASQLAHRVAELLGSDGRGRLFGAYATFCGMLITGEIGKATVKLERTVSTLAEHGHSAADMIRGGVLVARAHILAVAMGCVSDGELGRARGRLAVEYDRAIAAGQFELACQVGIEIAKLHTHAPSPDFVSARAILSSLLRLCSKHTIRDDTRFDIMRLAYHVSKPNSEEVEASVSLAELEAFAHPLGPISEALVALAVVRRGESADLSAGKLEEYLDRAHEGFAQNDHPSGAFEAAHKRATAALGAEHVVKAERWFEKACEHGKVGGFQHGIVVSLLGRYQCSMTSGAVVQATALIDEVRSYNSELATGTVGLSVAAALQMLGNHAQGKLVSRTCERFFAARGLGALASQAAFALGACAAGGGDWDGARKAWQRSMAFEEGRGAELAAVDRQIAVAQAIAMGEFSKTRTISEKAMASVATMLSAAEQRLALCATGLEYAKVHAKLLQTHAQLCVIGQQPVEAVKHLSRAREEYRLLHAQRDVALIDALSGLALLEVAKLRSPLMYEEAGAALQRALEFFSDRSNVVIRWKLKYYLCVAAYMTSQSKGRDEERAHWRMAAVAWLRDAMNDSELLSLGEGQINALASDADFSPGLRPEAFAPLKKMLGLEVPPPAADRKRKLRRPRTRRGARNLH